MFRLPSMLATLSLICCSFSSLAQQVVTTQAGFITSLGTGWIADQISVVVSVPLVNPGNCPNTVVYATDVAIADNKNQKAALMLAFAQGKQVILAVQGCSAQSYPRIVGVQVF